MGNEVKLCPILFNTEMVKAILNGKKTETRRPAGRKPLCAPGDILWVRETWGWIPCEECSLHDGWCPTLPTTYKYENGCFTHKADSYIEEIPRWRPSIHMPKEAARIFLKVLKVEQTANVSTITEAESISEGFRNRAEFIAAWEKMYPRQTNGAAWIIRFERVAPSQLWPGVKEEGPNC